MSNKLKTGMQFDSLVNLCEFVGWKYDRKHSSRLTDRLGKYVEFHRVNRRKIIIDSIINDNDMIQFTRQYCHKYSVGDIIQVNTGNAEILDKTHITTKSGHKQRAYKIKCMICGYEYVDYGYCVYKGIGCGCCTGKAVVVGINDIWTTNAETAKLLLNVEDGYKYTQYSSKKTDFICPACGSIHRNKVISNITNRGLACHCSKSKSYPNRFMFWLLSELRLNFIDEKTFEWSDRKRYDFYVPELSLIIEMQGIQHTVENISFIGIPLKQQIENDNYKKMLALTHGVKNYLQIDASSSDFDFIKNSVIKSGLITLFDMSNVDWAKINEICETPIIKEIADCWNSGLYRPNEIGKSVGLSNSPVRKFLHRCEEFGLIDKYDTKISQRLGAKQSRTAYYQNRAKPLFCNENNTYFGSITICAREMESITGLKFSSGNILGTATGKYKQHRGFTFSYISREQFNTAKAESPDTSYGDFFIVENSELHEQQTELYA